MLTEDMEAHLSMFMRVVEFLRNSEDVFRENKEFMEAYEEMKEVVVKIMDQLTEEDKDALLERYKEEMEYLEREKKKK
jgi:hypothetical protein